RAREVEEHRCRRNRGTRVVADNDREQAGGVGHSRSRTDEQDMGWNRRIPRIWCSRERHGRRAHDERDEQAPSKRRKSTENPTTGFAEWHAALLRKRGTSVTSNAEKHGDRHR